MLSADGAKQFLSVIKTVVLADGGPPGLKGRIRFGVASSIGPSWLDLDLGPQGVKAGPRGEAPAQVTVLLGQNEAQRILKAKELPEDSLFDVIGDKSLLENFLRRYFNSGSLVGVRMPGSSIRRRPNKRRFN